MFVLSCTVVLFVTYFVLARYIFKVDVPSFEELTTIIIFWLYFTSGSYASFKRTHIQADIINLLKNDRIKRLVRVISGFVSLVVWAIVMYLSTDYMLWNIKINAVTNVRRLPMWFAHSGIVVGFILMGLFDVVHLIADIKEYRQLRREKKLVEEE